MDNDQESIRRRLEDIAEAIADLALERLRESVERGDQEAAAAEKRLTRARRAVVKAAHLLAKAEPAD